MQERTAPNRARAAFRLAAFSLVVSLPSAAVGAGAAADLAAASPSLPGGSLHAPDLVRWFSAAPHGRVGLSTILALAADGEERVVPGDAVREVWRRMRLDAGLLPLAELREVRVGGGKLELSFDFGPSGEKVLRIPEKRVLTLVSKDESDPFAARAPNHALAATRESRSIRIRDRVRLSVEDGRVVQVERGDVEVRWALGWLPIALESLHQPGRIATRQGRPLLMLDEDGQPLVQSGQLVPRRADDWLVIRIAGRVLEIAVPALNPGRT